MASVDGTLADDDDGAYDASELVRHGVDASSVDGNDDVAVVLASGCEQNCVAAWPWDGGHADVLGPWGSDDSRWPI